MDLHNPLDSHFSTAGAKSTVPVRFRVCVGGVRRLYGLPLFFALQATTPVIQNSGVLLPALTNRCISCTKECAPN